MDPQHRLQLNLESNKSIRKFRGDLPTALQSSQPSLIPGTTDLETPDRTLHIPGPSSALVDFIR